MLYCSQLKKLTIAPKITPQHFTKIKTLQFDPWKPKGFCYITKCVLFRAKQAAGLEYYEEWWKCGQEMFLEVTV